MPSASSTAWAIGSTPARRPFPGHAAGQITLVGRNDAHAARAQRLDIFLRRGMVPHVDVHRRSDDDGRSRREIQGGQEIVGDASREFGQGVGGGRGDHEHVQ